MPMHKTLHKKLTAKYLSTPAQANYLAGQGGVLLQDADLIREIAQDLLQPRPQAVANLLKMAKQIS